MNLASYVLIRLMMLPTLLFSYQSIHRLGRIVGSAAFLCFPKFRKKALSNLALATSLDLKEEEIIAYARMSIQNLVITCLEYAKLGKEKHIEKVAICKNPSFAEELIQKGVGIIFFCGHQSNWEILFIEGTHRMPGVAIGRPIKNTYLYNWVLSIRERFGGKIITPQNAIKEGLRALKKGKFLGVVGDQGMPDSGYSSLFLGRMAWTSPLPAILAHRTGNPISLATTKRVDGHYEIRYSGPIWPNQAAPASTEIPRLMKESLSLLEQSIKESPGEWLWSHNRWKQQLPGRLKRTFRHDAVLVILPSGISSFKKAYDALPSFIHIYPTEFVVLMVPETYRSYGIPGRFEAIYYKEEGELFARDFRFKLVFNFTENKKLKPHYLSLSAFDVISVKDVYKIAKASRDAPFGATLEKAIYAR